MTGTIPFEPGVPVELGIHLEGSDVLDVQLVARVEGASFDVVPHTATAGAVSEWRVRLPARSDLHLVEIAFTVRGGPNQPFAIRVFVADGPRRVGVGAETGDDGRARGLVEVTLLPLGDTRIEGPEQATDRQTMPETDTVRPPSSPRPSAPPPPAPAPRPVIVSGDTTDASARVVRGASSPTAKPPPSPKAVRGRSSDRQGAEYRVWFGTNRRPSDSTTTPAGFSSERDATVHYGACRVFVPRTHRIGSLGSPWWKRLLRWTDDRLRIIETAEMEAARYGSEMARHLAPLPIEERHAVVFIHGYNVSFDQAALRAAQIGFDLSIQGVMAFFSWPSKGTLTGYPADEASIEASEDVIADYLVEVGQRSGAQALHVIAHSMGNRGVLRAINRIAADASRRAGISFGQFLLAAADVDRDVFLKMSAAYRQLARRTTLYVSTRDRAVEASKWLHQYSRVGLVPPVAVLPGIDTVEVRNVDLSLLGHGYVAEARDVLGDMHNLIRRDVPPDQRFGLRPSATETGERYWVIGA